MRAFLLSLAAAVNPDALISGSCTNTFPALDEQCSGAQHGSFNADSSTSSITDAEQCAGYVNTHCNSDGDKAIFFSFSPGTFSLEGATGICSWWTADGCPCYEGKDCAKPTNANGDKVTGVQTGNVKDYLNDNGDGIAPPRGDGDVNTDDTTIVDPNLAGGLADDMTGDEPVAEAAKLSTIPSGGEIAAGEPAKQMEMSEKDGHTQDGCPTGFRATDIAVNRKEWPCLAKDVGGLKSGGLGGMVVGSVGVGLLAAIFTHMRGKKIRKKAGGGDGDEGAALSGQDSDA